MPSTPTLTTKQKLNLETGEISWDELAVYFAKGILLRVSNNSDLIEVAEIIAENNTSKLEVLILNKKIEFMTSEWAKLHCTDNPTFWAVVVSPYVICQRRTE